MPTEQLLALVPFLLVLFALVVGVGLSLLDTTKLRKKLKTPQDPVRPVCNSCRHFDLEEGQAALRNHPVFLRAAAVLSPAEMGRTVSYEKQPCPECKTKLSAGSTEISCSMCNNTGEVEVAKRSPPSAPYRAKWAEYGACMSPDNTDDDGNNVVVWGGSCDCNGQFYQIRLKAVS